MHCWLSSVRLTQHSTAPQPLCFTLHSNKFSDAGAALDWKNSEVKCPEISSFLATVKNITKHKPEKSSDFLYRKNKKTCTTQAARERKLENTKLRIRSKQMKMIAKATREKYKQNILKRKILQEDKLGVFPNEIKRRKVNWHIIFSYLVIFFWLRNLNPVNRPAGKLTILIKLMIWRWRAGPTEREQRG